MNDELHVYAHLLVFREPNTTLFIQASLPLCLDTLPILLSIPGRGTERERSVPLAPPGRSTND